MKRNTLPRHRFARNAEEGGGGGQQGAQDQGGAGTEGAAPTNQQASPQAGSWDGKVESLPDGAQKMIRDLRKEAGDNRVGKTQAEQAAEQRQQDMLRAIAEAAGYKLPGSDEPIDPAKVSEELANERAARRQTDRKLAVLELAPDLGADTKRLLDSNSFSVAISEIDPGDREALTAAISKALTDNAWLKASRVPALSSADHTGGSGESNDPAAHARPGVNRIEAAYATSTT